MNGSDPPGRAGSPWDVVEADPAGADSVDDVEQQIAASVVQLAVRSVSAAP
jgi:hypothetical protein